MTRPAGPAAPAAPMAQALPGADDTIAAVATAPGRGAVALVRVSGARAFEVVGRVVRPWPLADRVATLCAVHGAEGGALLDRALVTCFGGARSYTGEPVVEIATHGGAVVPAAVLAALVGAGARQALPGEFTRRAVLHGKLDVVQAEAVADLVDARSGAMHRAALEQLDGGLSRRVAALREQLLAVEALLAYDIDFPEEDDGPVPAARVEEAARAALAQLDLLLATAAAGELVREGAVVVIAGAPNAGKSSLFNALLGRSRAIVTSVPGTTRDALEAVLDTERWPLRLVDTAGLRDTADVVERLGIEVSERYLAGAHVVLACGESDAVLAACVTRVAALTGAPVVPVRTKADLEEQRGAGSEERAVVTSALAGASPRVTVSAETGEGLRELVDQVAAVIEARYGAPEVDAPLVTRERHRRALAEARDEVSAFVAVWTAGALPAVVAAVHVRAAVAALEGLIGVVDVEQLLERVFGTFCVGK